MRTIVSKFGGSSAASAERFRQILAILRASPARRCVVLSAPGVDASHGEKVTALLARCWQSRECPHKRDEALSAVVARFREIALGLSLPDPSREVEAALKEALAVSEAQVLSRGEYLCAKLFAAYSGFPFVDAARLIAFDGKGGVDEAQTRAQFRDAFAEHGRMVVPGFYGADPDGSIRVFPRNGSDITGAIAAAALDAGLYENWTDVPGLMTADPDIVPEAQLIPQVSYRQMRALARAGARVLHPACLDPVALAGIPTRLRSTLRTECFGTLIDDECAAVAPCIAGRVEDNAAVISVFGIPEWRVRRALEKLSLDSIMTDYNGELVKVNLKNENFETALKGLHRELIE